MLQFYYWPRINSNYGDKTIDKLYSVRYEFNQENIRLTFLFTLHYTSSFSSSSFVCVAMFLVGLSVEFAGKNEKEKKKIVK